MAVDTPAVVGSVSIQGNAYPVYGSQARALEYVNARVGGDVFSAASFAEQQKSLVTARRLIDRQSFIGAKTVTTQFTEFPRDGETTVPIPVETAQYEIALLLLEDAGFFNQNTTGSNERRLRAGPVEIEFFSQTLRANTIGGGSATFPPQIQELLRPYLSSSVVVSAPVVGGLANESNVVPRVGNDIVDAL